MSDQLTGILKTGVEIEAEVRHAVALQKFRNHENTSVFLQNSLIKRGSSPKSHFIFLPLIIAIWYCVMTENMLELIFVSDAKARGF